MNKFLEFRVFTAVTMKVFVLWHVTPCSLVDQNKFFSKFRVEDRGSRFVQIFGSYLSNPTVSLPIILSSLMDSSAN